MSKLPIAHSRIENYDFVEYHSYFCKGEALRARLRYHTVDLKISPMLTIVDKIEPVPFLP